MTTRPPLGSQRPPQSSLSGSIQAGQRVLSHRDPALSQSKRTESHVGLVIEGESPPGPSNISRPKVSQSRNASAVGSPSAVEAVPKHPRGKPRLHFDTALEEEGNSVPVETNNHEDGAQIPMPARPRPRTRPSPKPRPQPSTTVKRDTRPKPYSMEVPAIAPHYPPNGHADFFPWIGNHPEDRFNDNVIRNGYFDKSPAQNDTGSAKTSVYPAVKQKNNLQMLSSLFVNVLDQRRAHGQINSASTFKPPPRVTLTDTKRETWLRDLANHSISLRRLSRTIPHGIRGKVLLEQCLSKSIPTERAVWLAKCVGANEIRASKRKGVSGTFALGGEAKWIRDWTGFVESFVESVINSCGERDWKAKIGYAFRFAAHLHSENLLDRDHYLDWLSSSLENCSLTKLPIWLLNTQIYWTELLQSRKHGRRVATALLTHLHTAHADPDTDILLPIIERLVSLVDGLITKHSENLISPTSWFRYKDTLQAYIPADDPLRNRIFEALDVRNSRLSIDPTAEKELSPRRRFLQLLDTSSLTVFSKSLPLRGWELSQDRDMLVRTLLEWATSLHRGGVIKVYIGARTLRRWSEFGLDITATILDFLGSDICPARRCNQSIYHLVCELTRSGHFSPVRYIEWLISGGRLRENSDVVQHGPCATRLLAEVPINKLSDSIETLRRNLLEKVGFSVQAEEDATRLAMAAIDAQPRLQGLPLRNGHSFNDPSNGNDISTLSDLSWTVKSELGLWLRKRVILHNSLPITHTKGWGPMVPDDFVSAITQAEFEALSKILEYIGDFAMHADILNIITTSENPDVLAAIADALNMHLENFAAIGALHDLFDKLYDRLRKLTHGHADMIRNFLRSLSDLAARVPDRQDIDAQLALEIKQSNRKAAFDACSPVSDHMVEVLQNAQVDFADEIEKVLDSGNTMDHATHDRLFQTIISRLEACVVKSPEQQRSCCELLPKLRTFDSEHFDSLMNKWLSRVFKLCATLGLAHFLAPLISNGCLSLKHALDACSIYLESNGAKENTHAAIRVAHEGLKLLLGTAKVPEIMSAAGVRHYQIRSRNMQKDHPKETILILKQAIRWIMASCSEADSTNAHIRQQFSSDCNDRRMTDLLRNLIVVCADTVKTQLILPLAQSSNVGINDCLQSLLDHQHLPSNRRQKTNLDAKTRVEKALQITDDLTFSFCELQIIFQVTISQDDDRRILLATLAESIETAVAANRMSWTSILPSLDPSTAAHLCQHAEGLFISLIPTTRAKDRAKDSREASEQAQTQASDYIQAKNFLHIIEATSHGISMSSGTPQLSGLIVDKLSDLWNVFASAPTESPTGDLAGDEFLVRQGSLSPTHDEAENGLLLLLRLITIHAHCSASPASSSTPITAAPAQDKASSIQDKSTTETRARLLLHVISLLLIFQNKQDTNMAMIIFDVAILLVDEYVSEEGRLTCLKAVRDRTLDERVRYLLGYGEADKEWLFLCQKSGGGGPGTAGPGPKKSGGEKAEELLKKYELRPWEMLSEPTPNIGENDTSLSLVLFGAGR